MHIKTEYQLLYIIEILPPLLYLLPLRPLIVVLLQNILARICQTPHSRFRDIFLELVRDTAATKGVRAEARWASRPLAGIHGFARIWIAVVRTVVAVLTGPGISVTVFRDRRSAQAA